MNMTRLADIMTVPAHTVAPEAPVSAAMALLRRTRGGALVVVDGERHPVGVFCQRDAALAACRPEGARAPSVAEIMTRPPLIASPDMGVAPAYRLMLEGKARHLVVADANGRLAGIVGEGDFLHHLGFPYRDRPGAAPPSAPPPADGPAGTGAGPARNAHAFGGPARAWLFALLAVALVLATEQVIEHFARQRLLAQERNAALASLSALRARVEGEINANLFLVHGLSAVIAARPDIDQAGFSVIARALVDERHALRNIAGAPDMVISLMYPLAGNEAAIGLDYRIHPAQREAALRARDSGRSVVAGPLRLRQGGIGIIVREPVFLDARRPGGERRFWGLVSAVIDAETLYRRAGLRDFDPGLRLALRAIEDAGSPGAVFFGDPDVFLGQPVTTEVMLPGGSWRLAAAPAGGWGRADTGIGVVRLLGLLAALVAGAMAWRLARGGQALAAAAARLRALLDTIPDLVWLKNPDGVYLACNPRFEQFLGARSPTSWARPTRTSCRTIWRISPATRTGPPSPPAARASRRNGSASPAMATGNCWKPSGRRCALPAAASWACWASPGTSPSGSGRWRPWKPSGGNPISWGTCWSAPPSPSRWVSRMANSSAATRLSWIWWATAGRKWASSIGCAT